MELVLTLDLPSDRRIELYGPADRNLRLIRDVLGVKIFARDSTVRLLGDSQAVSKAAAVIEKLQSHLTNGKSISADEVSEIIAGLAEDDRAERSEQIDVFRRSLLVRPKTPGQTDYVAAIKHHDLVLCHGPAGTGKTYLAVALALSLLKTNKIKRIVLARPAVEAGEKLGYLPGDLQAKVNPYLRPLFDAMHDMMDYDQLRRFIANDVIEVIPLAFMRGRTLNSAAIILDEAQNTTPQQMLMFLTRLGHHSKMIVTGDDSQIDLERGQKSGLIDAVKRFRHVPGVAVVTLTGADIVRHRLVTEMVHAYGNQEKS